MNKKILAKILRVAFLAVLSILYVVTLMYLWTYLPGEIVYGIAIFVFLIIVGGIWSFVNIDQ